jgi:hypothetical protein
VLYPAINVAFDALVPRGPTFNTAVHMYPIDGACHDVAADATTFGHRDANYAFVIPACGPTRRTTRPTSKGATLLEVPDLVSVRAL